MSEILAEMNEAIRQERMEKFWKENGNALVFFVIATILTTGLVSAWRSWDAKARIAGTEKIMTLMEDKTFPDNIREAELDVRGGLRGIVLINGAQEYIRDKKPADAMALYTRAADDNGIPAEIRDLAVLMQIRLAKDPASGAKADDEHLIKALAKIAGNQRSPWQYHAKLEAAAIAAEKQDYTRARLYLAGVMDEQAVPKTLYKKAQALDHVYALKEKQQAAKPAKTGS
jgi:hypothetical protein